MRLSWTLAALAALTGLAAWIAFTTPDVENIEITEEDWGL